LRRFRQTVSVGAEVTSDGKLFQRRLPATGNTRSPTVDSRVCRITSCKDDDDRRRRRLESTTNWMWSERYHGTRQCKQSVGQTGPFFDIKLVYNMPKKTLSKRKLRKVKAERHAIQINRRQSNSIC